MKFRTASKKAGLDFQTGLGSQSTRGELFRLIELSSHTLILLGSYLSETSVWAPSSIAYRRFRLEMNSVPLAATGVV